MDVKECDILGERINDHWYYVSKGRALLEFLGQQRAVDLLDVGAGSGYFSKLLLGADVAQRALCVDPAYPAPRSELSAGKQIRFVSEAEMASPDLVLMMDVIEHVDDDVGLLRKYADFLGQHGTILVTVPAFQFLWSRHDVFLEHKRRYTRASLHRTIEAAGLTVVRTRYFFSLLFPLICMMRLWGRLRVATSLAMPQSDLRVHGDLTNGILTAVHEIERKTLFRVNSWLGLTIFCLARK
ncbi:MAG TPA: methyltransferase domain-containing protein [Dongiaceae bacterium]|nr:methyltransferase domain-containing protein [Dongiaceae bacterium]